MNTRDILKNIAVQGSILDVDAEVYAAIIQNRKHPEGSEDLSVIVNEVIGFCEDGSLDPWSIDITSAISIFFRSVWSRFKNFSVAGMFVSQMLRLLYEKSKLLAEEDQTEEDLFEEMEDSFSEQEREYSPAIPLQEPIIHRERRSVMLVEVLEAVRLSIENTRKKNRATRDLHSEREDNLKGIVDTLNPEETEAEMMRVLDIINHFDGDEINLEDVWGVGRESQGSFFSFCLFLMRDGYIKLSQVKPYSDIVIRKMAEGREVSVIYAPAGQRK